ncbi:hypothetical protein Pint_26480 [Pistacia integerrima]|uniref:Uncharacterized protein n=1 Tax=Pistacia integerrima TaxID=434235 RepID=A0ACC0YFN1_9ROSI|nr:hypothetical protein Pint_26480 [Pistacia integerrima]
MKWKPAIVEDESKLLINGSLLSCHWVIQSTFRTLMSCSTISREEMFIVLWNNTSVWSILTKPLRGLIL